jgi:hypothetical protein
MNEMPRNKSTTRVINDGTKKNSSFPTLYNLNYLYFYRSILPPRKLLPLKNINEKWKTIVFPH